MDWLVQDIGKEPIVVRQHFHSSVTLTYPLVTDIGVEPKMPVRRRNMMKAAQLGAKHIARVKIVYARKVPTTMNRLP